jgi:hypothetical protein
MGDFKSMPILVNQVLSSLLYGDNYDVAKILLNWAEIIDERYFAVTKPIKISLDFKTKKKTLFIGVSSNSFGTELHYMKKGILDKINAFCGERTVEDIRIILRPIISR